MSTYVADGLGGSVDSVVEPSVGTSLSGSGGGVGVDTAKGNGEGSARCSR